MRSRIVLVIALVAIAQGCASGSAEPLCSGRGSVPEFILRFGQGLANFDDSVSLSLEADSVSALEVVLAARESTGSTKVSAERLADRIADFVGVMNSNDWIISEALDDERAVSSSDALGTEESLRDANTVEALVLARCGPAPTVSAPLDSVETLPPPSIAGATDTVPDAAQPDDRSDATAIGRAVAIQYGLTLTQQQLECLGSNLQAVSDATEAVSSPQQYQKQFQSAFDSCGIGFEVPGS